MYKINIFTIVNGRLHSEPFETIYWEIARYRLCWALNLPDSFMGATKEELEALMVNDESGKPILYQVTMPGYENLMPVYATFEFKELRTDGKEE